MSTIKSVTIKQNGKLINLDFENSSLTDVFEANPDIFVIEYQKAFLLIYN